MRHTREEHRHGRHRTYNRFIGNKLPWPNTKISFPFAKEIPHNELFVALRELIDTCGAVAFQNGRGLSTETFLELLNMYLSSAVVKYGDFLFVQKKGISIASCLAPVLCHAFLAKFDGMLQEAFDDTRVIRIFRYVDDFLIILNLSTNDVLLRVADNIMTVFKNCSKQLNFTRAIPPDNSIRFPDLRLTFCIGEHLCWMYEPRSKRGLLPFASAHSKLVKRSIANICFSNA